MNIATKHGNEPVLGDEDLLRVRMRALGLDGAGFEDTGLDGMELDGGAVDGAGVDAVDRVARVVDRLFAVQGQDWRSSKWAIGVRAPGGRASDVDAALNAGRIVRSWPMRSTVHLIAAEDIDWVQRLTNPRVIAGAAKRREFLGLDDATLERIVEISLEALARSGTSARGLDRDGLAAVWTDAGIDWKPSWRYHLVWWLCQNGLATFGPVPQPGRSSDPEPRLVLASEWIAQPRRLEDDEALAELAGRYVRGRGAITQKDLAAWSMLTAADAKRGLELAAEAGTVMRARREGVSGAAGGLWVAPLALDSATTTSAEAGFDAWRLLPAFDEHLLGYTLRDPQLAPGNLDRIIPGRNGMFLATVVHRGRVVGTWRRNPKTRTLEITGFPEERIDLDELQPDIDRWSEFYRIDAPAALLT